MNFSGGIKGRLDLTVCTRGGAVNSGVFGHHFSFNSLQDNPKSKKQVDVTVYLLQFSNES